ncbi:hypothetical protein HMI54_008063 [Coelomomyces lativittatus]|nr:hypothetical protein HMI55_006936 [Coelomomyces lativittatus]KAJ1511949.1 hypothetical protein HMI56_004722 [Coelomomyces lativittatus]KAJ1516810.1 hypothetical protein HMI54_008062 [Coelomomyces lativittatus]KAJ1516811.1 hypothetical protein HMI54_008063 [Coelomomyces lativittatus]
MPASSSTTNLNATPPPPSKIFILALALAYLKVSLPITSPLRKILPLSNDPWDTSGLRALFKREKETLTNTQLPTLNETEVASPRASLKLKPSSSSSFFPNEQGILHLPETVVHDPVSSVSEDPWGWVHQIRVFQQHGHSDIQFHELISPSFMDIPFSKFLQVMLDTLDSVPSFLLSSKFIQEALSSYLHCWFESQASVSTSSSISFFTTLHGTPTVCRHLHVCETLFDTLLTYFLTSLGSMPPHPSAAWPGLLQLLQEVSEIPHLQEKVLFTLHQETVVQKLVALEDRYHAAPIWREWTSTLQRWEPPVNPEVGWKSHHVMHEWTTCKEEEEKLHWICTHVHPPLHPLLWHHASTEVQKKIAVLHFPSLATVWLNELVQGLEQGQWHEHVQSNMEWCFFHGGKALIEYYVPRCLNLIQDQVEVQGFHSQLTQTVPFIEEKWRLYKTLEELWYQM